ncbi:MAG: RNA polymerase sigma factor [Acidobacteria bacterium]|jgi:RNA polymerase sigma-70 factor (ECF subfamily)|nr:RNA polymerase sigma factor [Acidobacteriota bacterium]
MSEDADKQREAAYLELLGRHGRIAPAVARLYTRAGEDAADLEQEIRLQWWRSLTGFSGRARASTWMYQVALHTALTFLRRRQRRLRADPLEHAGNMADPAPHAGGREDQRRTALHGALARLAPGERALAYLWLEELSHEEIATVSGMNANAVGVRLHRIRQRLKELLTAGKEGK